MCLAIFGCGQSVPHRIRSGAAAISACANGTASVNGGPALEMRSEPLILTQQFSIAARQLEQLPERRLLQPLCGRHAAHVIDDERHRQRRAADRIELEQIGGIEMQIDVPAQRADARQHALELTHVGHAAQMLDEIEAHAAKPLAHAGSRSRAR